MKKIWIVNYYTAPPEYSYNPRHLEFASFLMDVGYDVTIISASYLHHKKINLIKTPDKFVRVNYDRFNFIHIKTKSYYENNFLRMFSIFQFSYRLLMLRNRIDKPDIVLHNLHVPFDFLVYLCAKRVKAMYIAEVWDLWPESFVSFGLINKNNPFLQVSYQLEKKLYKNADSLIFSLEGGQDYIKEKKWDINQGGPVNPNKIYYINNGVDINKFKNNSDFYRFNDEDLNDDKCFKVIYLGSIRMVNNIKQLIDAAFILRDYTNIKFILYGDGPDRINLENYCKDNNIKNVLFKQKSISFEYVPYILSCSSLNILNYQKDFGKYGTSSNKLFLYLASGRPIISNTKMNYCLISKYNLGISKDIESAQQYADAILTIKNMDIDSYNAMCKRALVTAEQFDYKILNNKLLEVINQTN